MGQGAHVPQYLDWGTLSQVSLPYLSTHVKPSCLYSTRRNVELWIVCNVLFLCMVPFNHGRYGEHKMYFSTNIGY